MGMRGTGSQDHQVMGMRGTGSQDLVLKDVFVPDAAVSGRRPQGTWHMLFHIISMIAFAAIYSAYVGVAEGARDKALAVARRKPKDAHLPYLVGEMENALVSAKLALDEMIAIAITGAPAAWLSRYVSHSPRTGGCRVCPRDHRDEGRTQLGSFAAKCPAEFGLRLDDH
eukprot:gene50661-68905_t